MSLHRAIDAITEADLRGIGSHKWTTYPDALGSFVAEMDFGLADPIQRVLRQAIKRGATGYLPLPLIDQLGEATASFLRTRFGWQLDPSAIRPVVDVLEAYRLTLDLFSPDSPKVVIPTPSYPQFLGGARLAGRTIIEMAMPFVEGRWALPLDAIERELRDGPALVVLCNPHNPTGTMATREEMTELARIVDSTGSRVFSDEIHCQLVYPSAPHAHIPYASTSACAASHTVTATSASKGWAIPGLKCAQMIFTNEADLSRWRDGAPGVEYSASPLGARAAIAAYTEGVPWLDEVLTYLEATRDVVLDTFSSAYPGIARVGNATYFAWINLTGLVDEGNPSDVIREQARVALYGGAAFGTGLDRCVRMTYASPRHLVEEMVDRILNFLSESRFSRLG